MLPLDNLNWLVSVVQVWEPVKMIARILMASVACLWLVGTLQAEPAVFFRGKELTYRHFVYGEVTSCATTAGTVNLGYAHGIQDGQVVGILRRSGGNLLPVGVMKLTDIKAGQSFGTYEGAFTLKPDDIVIVSARTLNLWKGGTRSDQLAIKTILTRDDRGYDTADVSPELLDEVGRDDNLVNRKFPPLHVNVDVYSSRLPFVRPIVVRGAFRLATGDQDGPLNTLSKEDRDLSPDNATLSLQSGLARFVASSREGKLTADDNSIRTLAAELPGVVDLETVTAEVNQANFKIGKLLRR